MSLACSTRFLQLGGRTAPHVFFTSILGSLTMDFALLCALHFKAMKKSCFVNQQFT